MSDTGSTYSSAAAFILAAEVLGDDDIDVTGDLKTTKTPDSPSGAASMLVAGVLVDDNIEDSPILCPMSGGLEGAAPTVSNGKSPSRSADTTPGTVSVTRGGRRRPRWSNDERSAETLDIDFLNGAGGLSSLPLPNASLVLEAGNAEAAPPALERQESIMSATIMSSSSENGPVPASPKHLDQRFDKSRNRRALLCGCGGVISMMVLGIIVGLSVALWTESNSENKADLASTPQNSSGAAPTRPCSIENMGCDSGETCCDGTTCRWTEGGHRCLPPPLCSPATAGCGSGETCCDGTTCHLVEGSHQVCLPQCQKERGGCGSGERCCDGTTCQWALDRNRLCLGQCSPLDEKCCFPVNAGCGSGETCCEGTTCQWADGGHRRCL